LQILIALVVYAGNCDSSEQPLPLVSEEGRSRSSAVWFKVPQSLMTFSLGFYHGAPHHIRQSIRMPLHHLSAPTTSEFKVFLQGELYTCHWCPTTCI